jgi:hypothetical protein
MEGVSLHNRLNRAKESRECEIVWRVLLRLTEGLSSRASGFLAKRVRYTRDIRGGRGDLDVAAAHLTIAIRRSS